MRSAIFVAMLVVASRIIYGFSIIAENSRSVEQYQHLRKFSDFILPVRTVHVLNRTRNIQPNKAIKALTIAQHTSVYVLPAVKNTSGSTLLKSGHFSKHHCNFNNNNNNNNNNVFHS